MILKANIEMIQSKEVTRRTIPQIFGFPEAVGLDLEVEINVKMKATSDTTEEMIATGSNSRW